ncbi:helix-turn-helix domain-containing protein [Streptomyces sp. NPDC053474]|uniref:helix-turn-helix domain-containing protein n=1 Tax=Streptomyces sp. NPDC053474 TaxID=3365704 RepID=UPI0037D0BA24
MDSRSPAPGGGGRGVLEGAFALLEELSRVGEAGLTQLAAGANLPKATAHRLLEQLLALGAVRRRAGRYRMGSRMFRLGQSWQSSARTLRMAAGHPLRQLATLAPGTSIGLTVAETDRTMIMCGILGEVEEILPCGSGTLLPPGSVAEQIMSIDTPRTEPPSPYSAREWERLLTRARDRGLAVGHSDTLGVHTAAAPVYAPDGTIIAAVGASVLDAPRLAALADNVRRAADMTSAALRQLNHRTPGTRPTRRPPSLP